MFKLNLEKNFPVKRRYFSLSNTIKVEQIIVVISVEWKIDLSALHQITTEWECFAGNSIYVANSTKMFPK